MIPIGQARLAGNLNADEMVMLAGKQYPMDKAKRVYEKLTQPRDSSLVYDGSRIVQRSEHYHESPNIIGDAVLRSGDIPITKVDFIRRDPNSGDWNLFEPENPAPIPTRELINLKRNFDRYTQQNPGVYSNTPISEHRAKAYRKQGFVDVNPDKTAQQVLDARRFQNSPAVQDLLSVMDRVNSKPSAYMTQETAELLPLALEASRANQIERRAAKLQAQQAVNLVDAAIDTPVIAATPQQRAKFVINKATGEAQSFIDRGEGYVPYKTMSIEDARTAYAKARDAGWGVEHEMV